MTHPSKVQPLTIAPTATITAPSGFPWLWHAAYTDGVFNVQLGHLAFTKRGIERKARRTLKRLDRDQQRSAQAYELRP